MLSALPGSPLFQSLLNGIGWILARLYDVIPNFGVSIIILTVLIRVVLLPLGIKQIKQMQAMQAIQPKVKELQKKYKSNKQKQQEETMKLYRDHGVSPFGGCLPLLLQFPLLVAMYAVVRPPQLVAVGSNNQAIQVLDGEKDAPAQYQARIVSYRIHNNHLPVDSQLFENVITHSSMGFAALNLQCSASQAGSAAKIVDSNRINVVGGKPIRGPNGSPIQGTSSLTSTPTEDCGSSSASKVPYFLFLAAMIATTFYQQRQMQRASPPGATSQQQQTLMMIMPVMFGIFGFAFPSGLVVYWTTANFWQIGQQTALMRLGHIGPDALERRKLEMESKQGTPKKTGFMSRLMDRASQERARRDEGGSSARPAGSGRPKPSGGRPSGGSRSTGSKSSGSRPTGGSGARSAGGRKPPPKKKPGGSGGSSNG